MMDHMFSVFSPAMLFLGVFWILVTVYVLYDILFVEDLTDVQKLIWVLMILFLNIVGVLFYLVLVKMIEMEPFEGVGRSEASRLDDLEKLHELRETGALTEEEFQREKERVLGSG